MCSHYSAPSLGCIYPVFFWMPLSFFCAQYSLKDFLAALSWISLMCAYPEMFLFLYHFKEETLPTVAVLWQRVSLNRRWRPVGTVFLSLRRGVPGYISWGFSMSWDWIYISLVLETFLLHSNSVYCLCFQTLSQLPYLCHGFPCFVSNVFQSSWNFGVCSLVFFLPVLLIRSAQYRLITMLSTAFNLISQHSYLVHFLSLNFLADFFFVSFNFPSKLLFHALCNFLV